VKRAAVEAPEMPTEERVAAFGRQQVVEQLDSLPLDDFQQKFEGRFVDESYSFFPYELLRPCTDANLALADRSELVLFEDVGGRFVCRLLRRYDQVPFGEQKADLRRMLGCLPIVCLPTDRS
jgi:hypothetical protein